MNIYTHIHSLPWRKRGKLPCFFLQINWQTTRLPLVCTHLYLYGHFQRHGDTVPLTKYTERVFQQSLLSLFSQLYTKTVWVLPAALLCKELQEGPNQQYHTHLWCCHKRDNATLEQQRNPAKRNKVKRVTSVIDCSRKHLKKEKESFQTKAKTLFCLHFDNCECHKTQLTSLKQIKAHVFINGQYLGVLLTTQLDRFIEELSCELRFLCCAPPETEPS